MLSSDFHICIVACVYPICSCDSVSLCVSACFSVSASLTIILKKSSFIFYLLVYYYLLNKIIQGKEQKDVGDSTEGRVRKCKLRREGVAAKNCFLLTDPTWSTLNLYLHTLFITERCQGKNHREALDAISLTCLFSALFLTQPRLKGLGMVPPTKGWALACQSLTKTQTGPQASPI